MTFTPEQAAAEEARAQLWRDQQARRVAYQTRLWWSLAGSPTAAAQLRKDWDPVVQWLLERDQPQFDPQDDPGFDPLGISDSVNVGT
jgi:hypothetical protein